MPKKNDFKLDVVSVRLVKDAPIYSEHTFNNPADIAAVMGDCMCQFDREVVCVVNLRSDLKCFLKIAAKQARPQSVSSFCSIHLNIFIMVFNL